MQQKNQHNFPPNIVNHAWKSARAHGYPIRWCLCITEEQKKKKVVDTTMPWDVWALLRYNQLTAMTTATTMAYRGHKLWRRSFGINLQMGENDFFFWENEYMSVDFDNTF